MLGHFGLLVIIRAVLEVLPDVYKRQVISSTNDGPTYQLNIYPNPAFDILQIEWPNDQAADIHIYSPLGQLISKSRIDAFSLSTIDIQHLLPGYYIVKAVTPQNQTFISKLIKQ